MDGNFHIKTLRWPIYLFPHPLKQLFFSLGKSCEITVLEKLSVKYWKIIHYKLRYLSHIHKTDFKIWKNVKYEIMNETLFFDKICMKVN